MSTETLPHEPAATTGRRGRARTAAVVVAGTAVTLGAVWGAAYAVAGDRTARGTTVLGVDVGGLEPTVARAHLERALRPRAQAPVPVSAGGRAASVSPSSAGLSFDVAATVRKAGGRSWQPVHLVHQLFGGGRTRPIVRVDARALDAAVTKLAATTDRPAVEGAVTFAADGAHQIAPQDGVALDRPAAATALRRYYLTGSGRLPLATRSSHPRVGAAAVATAMASFAAPALSAPVSLASGAARVPVPVAVLAPTLSLTPDASGALKPGVDGTALLAAVAPRIPALDRPPRNATFRIVHGRPVVVPGVPGTSFDPTQLSSAVLAALTKQGAARVAAVGTTTSPPALTTAAAAKLGVVEKLATFTQHFPYAAYRVQNIGRAARYIDGTLLLPGETFSMNGTVQERTAANGYTIGTVIADGRFREELGGGVSTITTAMWHTAFYAGVERVEQRAHSFYISRYQPGLEATVAWGSLDLKFRNDAPTGLFIQAKAGQDHVTLTMWGTKRFDVTEATGPRTNVRPPGTIYDPKPGCVYQDGVPGFDIVVTRQFRQGGRVVKSEPLATHYNVANQIYCRAAPAPPKPATPKPTPTPSPTAAPAG